jgi:hypothetical protein
MCELHYSPPSIGLGLGDAPPLRKKFCLGNPPPVDLAHAALIPSGLGLPEKPQPSPVARRKKLWELDHRHHCSVIGTCLTLAELRQIQRRLGGSVQALDTDYDVHRVFVSAAREAVFAIRLIHKLLDRKYKTAIQNLVKAQKAAEVEAYWKTALAGGDIAGAYWALLTHPGIANDLIDRVYGEVHMLSHLSGASIRIDLQELNRLKRRCPELETQLAEMQTLMRRRLAEQQDVIGALNQRLAQTLDTERQLQAAQAQLAERTPVTPCVIGIADLTAQLAAERDRANRAETTVNACKQEMSQAIEHHQWLAQQLAESRQERDLLEATLEQWLSQPCPNDDAFDNDAAEDRPDLVGRCVLYVGGRRSQCGHFRELVERCNGRFLHHDGGREDSRAHLWDVVQQADAVLCPLDCVSHDAVHRIKRFCERNTKPLVLLPRASLAAFNRGLSTVTS